MTGSWSHGGAIHLMPAPNPWLPSYHTFFTWKYNQLISWGADDKKERWRESTEMKLTGINSMGLEKKNKTGTTPHSWCFKVGHSVIHSHPKRQCDEPGRLEIQEQQDALWMSPGLLSEHHATLWFQRTSEPLELIQVLDLWVICSKCRIAIKILWCNEN